MQPPSQGQSSGSQNDPSALEIAFREYQLLMEGTDKISDRRQTVNTEFVSINALFLTGVGYLLLQLSQNPTHSIWFVVGFFLIALIMQRINSTWLKLSNFYKGLIDLRIRYMKQLELLMRQGGVFPEVVVPLKPEEAATPGQKTETTRGTYATEDVLFNNPDASKGRYGFSDAEQRVAHTFITAYWIALLMSVVSTGIVIAQYYFQFKITFPFF